MRLTKYLSLLLLKYAFVAAFILAFIAEVLDLVENAEDVLDRGSGVYGIVHYAVLKMPTLLTHSLPLGALVGGLMTLLTLARNSEITAMRSAGVSTWRLYLMMVPGAIFLVLAQSTLLDVIAPKTEARLSLIMSKQIKADEPEDPAADDAEESDAAAAPKGDALPRAATAGTDKPAEAKAADAKPADVKTAETKPADGKPGDKKAADGKDPAVKVSDIKTGNSKGKSGDNEPKPIFLRVGDAVVSFEQVGAKARKLKNLRVYDRGPNKQVTSRIMAAEARYEKRQWILKDAERVTWTKTGFNGRTPADGVWETKLTPDDVLAALSPEARISLTAARAVLAGRMTPNAPLPFYETLVERVYAAPLAALVMVLLAMPASLVSWRDTRTGRHAVFALGAGLFFILCDGLWSTLALTGAISPQVGAWTALFVFAIFGAIRVTGIDLGWRLPSRPKPDPRTPVKVPA